MDALIALHSRNSVNLLCEPGPSQDQLNNIFKAGLRACDHKNLRPWKFLTIQGQARIKFGKLMADVKESASSEPLSKELREKLSAKPFRAPLIIVVVAKITKHEKVPEIEQLLSAGASAQMMMTAAHAQGVGAIWRSGSMMFQPKMRQGLGLNDTDQIVGFLYLGTPKAIKALPELDPENYVSEWS
jgi:nitroreductase